MSYFELALLGMIMFGLELTFSKVATVHVSPESVALLRSVVASVLIATFMMLSKIGIGVSRFSSYACIAGALMGIGFILMFRAYATGPVSAVAPITGLSCMIPTLFGILILHETVSPSKLAGIAFACAAIILISR